MINKPCSSCKHNLRMLCTVNDKWEYAFEPLLDRYINRYIGKRELINTMRNHDGECGINGKLFEEKFSHKYWYVFIIIFILVIYFIWRTK